VLNILLTLFTGGAFAAAGIYACIASKQLDQMRKNARIELRPYVAVTAARWRDEKLQDDVSVCFENGGSTPAERFNVHPWLKDGITPLPQFHHLDVPSRGSNERGATIPARSPYCAPLGIGADRIRSVLQKMNTLSVFGSFEYMNVFDEYCCEPFQIAFNNNAFQLVDMGENERPLVCPQGRANVCEPQNDNDQSKK
jgi:hypothetical protein